MAPKGRRRRQRDITARELADYGSPAAGIVNIDAAARGMGWPDRRYVGRFREPKQRSVTPVGGGCRGGAKPTSPKAPARGACCKPPSAADPAAGRSTPKPRRRLSVFHPAPSAGGRPAPSTPQPSTSRPCGHQHGVRPGPRPVAGRPSPTFGPARRAAKRYAPAANCGSAAPKAPATTRATATYPSTSAPNNWICCCADTSRAVTVA
jgi:hypothetical protein